MRYEQIAIYGYDDLLLDENENIKDRVLERFRQWNEVDYECDLEYHAEKLAELGYDNAKVYFSGFCSQGDGASFEADVDLEKVLLRLGLRSERFIKKTMLDFTGCYWKIYTSGRYNHKGSMSISSDWNLHGSWSVKADKIVNSAFEEAEEAILDEARSLAQDIYSDFEKEYEYQNSEYILELIQINEYEFYEDGTMA